MVSFRSVRAAWQRWALLAVVLAGCGGRAAAVPPRAAGPWTGATFPALAQLERLCACPGAPMRSDRRLVESTFPDLDVTEEGEGWGSSGPAGDGGLRLFVRDPFYRSVYLGFDRSGVRSCGVEIPRESVPAVSAALERLAGAALEPVDVAPMPVDLRALRWRGRRLVLRAAERVDVLCQALPVD